MNKVTIYSTPTCQYCKMAKQFFKDNNVEYTDIDVSTDQDAAQEMIEKSGQMGVLVIIVEKEEKDKVVEEIILGFAQPKLVEVLGIPTGQASK